MDCLFCKIVAGDIPTHTLYEDAKVKVFLDIHPHSNGHMLVVPKKHYVDILDIDKELLIYIYKVIAPKMYKVVQEKLQAVGLIIGQNNGIVQEIKHYHVHLIPKYEHEEELLDVKKVFKILKKKPDDNVKKDNE